MMKTPKIKQPYILRREYPRAVAKAMRQAAKRRAQHRWDNSIESAADRIVRAGLRHDAEMRRTK